MTDLEIVALPRVTGEDPCLIPDVLPQGSCLFIAPSNSGKTNLIVNLLLRKRFGYLTHYSKVYIFSPTAHSDQSWDLLHPEHYRPYTVTCIDKVKRQTCQFILDDEFSEEKLNRIMQQQDKLPSDSRPKILIVLDDVASELRRDSRTLNRLAMRGRHSKIWTWISSQLYKKLPRSIRVNIPYLVFFQVNQNELKTISEELATDSVRAWETMFKRATSEQYSFLTVDQKKAVAARYTSSFKSIQL